MSPLTARDGNIVFLLVGKLLVGFTFSQKTLQLLSLYHSPNSAVSQESIMIISVKVFLVRIPA